MQIGAVDNDHLDLSSHVFKCSHKNDLLRDY